jgi:transcriptional regulator with XRE-family HTH domain
MEKPKNTERHPAVEKIIKIRNDKRLSQIDFSELIGIDYTSYNKIESGYQKLSLENLSKIATNLQMREIDIFTYPQKYSEIDTKNDQLDITLMLKLKPEIKNQILSLIFGNEFINLLN